MKAPLFQLIVTGVALGLMSGAVAIHALHVSGAKEMTDSHNWSGDAPQNIMKTGAFVLPTEGGRTVGNGSLERMVSTPQESERVVDALEAIVERLEKLKDEKDDLHDQVEAINSELMEHGMLFDMLDRKFIPMPVNSGSSDQNPLLPPKSPGETELPPVYHQWRGNSYE